MFKKKEKPTEELDDVQTIIGPSIEVKGDFEGGGDVIVEGKLSGTLKTKRDLRIGPGAKVEADIEAMNVLVAGEIKGNVKALEGIELASGSRVTGDIETKNLLIDKGAIFNGSCVMTGETIEIAELIDKKEKKKDKKKEKDLEEETLGEFTNLDEEEKK